jgi:HK97 family phage portal protein
MAQLPSPAALTAVKSNTPRLPARSYYDTGNQGISRLVKPEDFLNALKLSPLLFACVNLRASTIGKYELRALTPDNEEVFGPNPITSNRKHRLYRLLQRPNPHQTRFQFFYTIQMCLDLLGNCLVLLDGVDGLRGLPTSLWPLDPSRSEPAFGENGLEGYYFTDANKVKQLIPVDRVLHFQRPNPANMYWGLGIAEVVAKEINIQSALTEYISQFFNQGAQPSGIIVAPGSMSDESFERFKYEAQTVMAGSVNQHRLAVFDNGVEFKQLSATLKDLGAEELDKILMKKILTAFEVPGTKFGLLEFVGYKAVDMERSFTEAMESAAAMIEDELTKLAGLYDKDGDPVPPPEIESVRNSTFYEGDPKGLDVSFVIPSKEPLATNVKTASDLNNIPTLTPVEKRNGSLQLLGSILTAPSGYKNQDTLSAEVTAALATPAPATPPAPEGTAPAAAAPPKTAKAPKAPKTPKTPKPAAAND